jgi:hypothetical protein
MLLISATRYIWETMSLKIRDTGILVYPPFRMENGSASLSFRDSAEQLRFYLCYFDKVAHIDVNCLPYNFITSSSEELQLIQSGNLQTFPPRVVPSWKMDKNFISQDMSRVYRRANSDGQRWALAIPPGLRADHEVEEWNAAKLTIENILPSPDISVPIGDVISFREAHSSDLQRMHFAIDKIFASFPDKDNLDLAADELRNQISDVVARFDSDSFPYIKPTLDVSNIIAAGAGSIAEAFAISHGASAIIAGTVCALGQGLKIVSKKSSLARPGNRYPPDFEYVFHALSDGMQDKHGGAKIPIGGLRPTVFENNLFTTSLLPFDHVNRWSGGGKQNFNTVVNYELHHPFELGGIFQAWSEHYVPDDDEKFDSE